MHSFIVPVISTLALGLAAGANAKATIAEDAVSFTTEGFEQPDQQIKRQSSENSEKSLPDQAQQGILSGFYVYDAVTSLYYDDDYDGHFYGVRVVFDADTDYFHSNVYARLSLSLEGGPWIPYFTTEVFGINGSSGLDDYVVETELFSGYPTGYYDLRIELFDTYGHRVDVFGPGDSSELSGLPLEDQQKDAGFIDSPPLSISRGGGGSTGLTLLLLMGAACARRVTAARR